MGTKRWCSAKKRRWANKECTVSFLISFIRVILNCFTLKPVSYCSCHLKLVLLWNLFHKVLYCYRFVHNNKQEKANSLDTKRKFWTLPFPWQNSICHFWENKKIKCSFLLSFCLHIKVLLSVLVLVWMTLKTERTLLSQEPNGFRQLIRSHNRSSSFRSQIPVRIFRSATINDEINWTQSLKFPLTRSFKVDMCAICVDYCWSLRDLEDYVVFYLPGRQWSLIDERSYFYSEKNFGFFLFISKIKISFSITSVVNEYENYFTLQSTC